MKLFVAVAALLAVVLLRSRPAPDPTDTCPLGCGH